MTERDDGIDGGTGSRGRGDYAGGAHVAGAAAGAAACAAQLKKCIRVMLSGCVSDFSERTRCFFT